MGSRPVLDVRCGDGDIVRVEVARHGTRLGRSSANDIHFSDAALSRNHCMFEYDGDGIRVIDLASANGTYVNGERVGDDARRLEPGDIVTAGSVEARVVMPDDSVLSGGYGEKSADGFASVDGGSGGDAGDVRKTHWLPATLVGLACAVLAAAAATLLRINGERRAEKDDAAEAVAPPGLVAFEYERVDADESHILRYAAALDASGMLSVEFDDSLGEKRRARRRDMLGAGARATLERIFSAAEWHALESRYAGLSAESENMLKSLRIKAVWRNGAKEVRVENASPPVALDRMRERIEALVNNELGVQVLRRSSAQLMESSEHSEELGDAMWNARDVEVGNLAASIAHYLSAKNDLATVGSSGKALARLKEKLAEAEAELARRYERERIDAERAENIGDWERARDGFRRILDMIPSRADRRHAEAEAHLVDIETRIEQSRKSAKKAARGERGRK